MNEDGTRRESVEGARKKGLMERRRDRKQEKKDKKENVASKLVAGLGKNIKEFAMEGMFGRGPEIGEFWALRRHVSGEQSHPR